MTHGATSHSSHLKSTGGRWGRWYWSNEDCGFGEPTYLDTKGMFKARIQVRSRASRNTWVYVVGGDQPEPLLGEKDAEDLRIITFKPEGKKEVDECHILKTHSTAQKI